jgi:membrane protein involved in colicin uptake
MGSVHWPWQPQWCSAARGTDRNKSADATSADADAADAASTDADADAADTASADADADPADTASADADADAADAASADADPADADDGWNRHPGTCSACLPRVASISSTGTGT